MDFDIALLLLFAVVAAAGCLYFWRRYRSTVRKVTFLFNAIDNGDYSFRFAEGDKAAGDRVLNRSLNRVKDILMHARDEQMERENTLNLYLTLSIRVLSWWRTAVGWCFAITVLHRNFCSER